MKKRLLLISNSVSYGKGYLDHCAFDIVDFLGDIKTVLFVPYALRDRKKYVSIVRKRFAKMGIDVLSIHNAKDPIQSVKKAQALFVGGGNTFRLLAALHKEHLIDIIRKKIEGGMPYIGSSAGSNVVCPTIKTTNDMPIVCPPTFDALNLVPFQINPHYIDAKPDSRHMGETREQRIKEFLEENRTTVVGLREGTWMRIENDSVLLRGKRGIRVFERGKEPREYSPQNSLNFLLKK